MPLTLKDLVGERLPKPKKIIQLERNSYINCHDEGFNNGIYAVHKALDVPVKDVMELNPKLKQEILLNLSSEYPISSHSRA